MEDVGAPASRMWVTGLPMMPLLYSRAQPSSGPCHCRRFVSFQSFPSSFRDLKFLVISLLSSIQNSGALQSDVGRHLHRDTGFQRKVHALRPYRARQMTRLERRARMGVSLELIRPILECIVSMTCKPTTRRSSRIACNSPRSLDKHGVIKVDLKLR